MKKKKPIGKATGRRGVAGRSSSSQTVRREPEQDYVSQYVHPLSRFKDVGPLNDIQQLITEAIMTHGEPCEFEKIFDFVNSKWNRNKIKRRDGTPYATDPRRVILANLRYNPSHVSLFRKDGDIPKAWRLCYSLEEATRAAKEAQEKEKRKQQADSEDAAPATSSAPANSSDAISDGNKGSANMTSRSKRLPRLKSDEDEFRVLPVEKLSVLQGALSWILFSTNQAATLNTLINLLGKYWPAISQADNIAGSEMRGAILSALTVTGDHTFVFMREPSNFLKWRVSPYHPWLHTLSDEEREKAMLKIQAQISG